MRTIDPLLQQWSPMHYSLPLLRSEPIDMRHVILIALLAWGCQAAKFECFANEASFEAVGLPKIQSMASEWLDVAEIAHMPSLHNFHDMAACAPDLVGVNFNPDGQLFDWPTGPRWFRYITLPLVTLKINNLAPEASRCRWYPYQALRQGAAASINCESSVRMLFERPGFLYQIILTNSGSAEETAEVDLTIPGLMVPGEFPDVIFRSTDSRLGKAHTFGDADARSTGANKSDLYMAHAFVEKPDECVTQDGAVVARRRYRLKPQQSVTIRFVMTCGRFKDPADAKGVVADARKLAEDFDSAWLDVESRWGRRWTEMFTPGNAHFSGSLPTLVTTDRKLCDIYYRSLLTLLVLHRTNMKMCDRVFVTSGERQKGVVFFWDTSMWAKIFALLEPEKMKQHCRLFLACDPHRGPVYNMDLGEQWDGWYAANDSTIFLFVNEYLNVTNDAAFLDERIGERTVLEHLETLATNWQKLQKDKSVMLADYGDNRNLLECAPAYVNRVPSFNAANVWMMRTVAELLENRGNTTRAEELRGLANQVSRAVLSMYKPGEGVWSALHRDGKKVELRHCFDFVCIGRYMPEDLTPEIKQEMVAFVVRELITDNWMRAMSPRDQAAAVSDRPDHGPMGAYDAWPALSAESMCLLGAWRPALAFFDSTQEVLYEGVYGQAREYYGEHRMQRDAPVRIAMRGACMRESVGGGAFSETILGVLFGFRPQLGRPLTLFEPKVDRGFVGTLHNLPFRGEMYDIVSDDAGVSLRDAH
jgi:hypothetical protein